MKNKGYDPFIATRKGCQCCYPQFQGENITLVKREIDYIIVISV